MQVKDITIQPDFFTESEPLALSDLHRLEAVIERGQQTFIEVGLALAEIQERKGYRTAGYSTFEEYCQKRWGWERRQAYNYIEATEVIRNVHSNAQSLPTLTQAVHLAPLPPEEQREIAQAVDFSQVTTRELKAIIRERKEEKRTEREEAKRTVPADLPDVDERYALHHGDFRNVSIPTGGVDIIITDPPYPREFLPLYADLARVASDVLKPGGSLLVMAGQSYLPEILSLMAPHIRYHWTLSYLTPGGQAVQLWQRKVNTFWKPVLWFTNGEYQGDWQGDVARSNPNDNDKRFHHWGQSESGMADLVERFTYPGQTILDPFLGGGTTGVVAVGMNRRFIGVDIDADAITTTRQRLAELAHVS